MTLYQHHFVEELLELAEVPSCKEVRKVKVEHVFVDVAERIVHFPLLWVDQH